MVFCCSICDERLERPGIDEDSRVAFIECGHVFHYSCIKTWWLKVYKDLRAEGIMDSPASVPCIVCRTPSLTKLIQIDLASSVRDDHLYPTEEEANEILMLEQNIKESKARINKAEAAKALRDAEIKELEEIKARLEAELAELTKNDLAQVEDVNTIQESNEPVAGPSRLMMPMPMKLESPTNVSPVKENVSQSPEEQKSDNEEKKSKSRKGRGSTNDNVRSGKRCSIM